MNSTGYFALFLNGARYKLLNVATFLRSLKARAKTGMLKLAISMQSDFADMPTALVCTFLHNYPLFAEGFSRFLYRVIDS